MRKVSGQKWVEDRTRNNKEVQIVSCWVGKEVAAADREYEQGPPLRVCLFVITEQEQRGASARVKQMDRLPFKEDLWE